MFWPRSRRIKLGIVGAGHIAERTHLPVLTRLRNVAVSAICDHNDEVAQRVANRFHIPRAYTDLDEMLEQEPLDVVDILTPPDTHARLATTALRRGKHCITEKPLAMTTREADQVIQTSMETGMALHVTHNFSYFPAIRKAKEIVRSGALGELTAIDIQYLTSVGGERYFSADHWCHRMPGGIFFDILPHLIMHVVEFLGDVNRVQVMTRKVSTFPHIPADELKAIMDASRGLASIHLSMNSPLTLYTIALTGTKMSLWVNADAQLVVWYRPIVGYRTVGSFKDGIPRGLGVTSQIWQQVTGLASVARDLVFGRLDYLSGHRYLINSSLRSLSGYDDYPVALSQCREVVSVLEKMFGPLG
jgi:predicted dehydrogenase